jgi:hypothetical protein
MDVNKNQATTTAPNPLNINLPRLIYFLEETRGESAELIQLNDRISRSAR